MSMSIQGMDSTLKLLEKLSDQGKVETIAKKAVESAQPINEEAYRSALASAEAAEGWGGGISGSVSSTPAKINERGAFAVARPTGRSASGTRNGELAAYLEYGTPPHKWGHAEVSVGAHGFSSRAVHQAEQQCVKTMEDIVRSEMECES